MPLDRIVRLRDYGVFQNFVWPASLSDFPRFNLVYGWNGSGKTTLSRLLRHLENKSTPPKGQVSLSINGNEISGAAFGAATLGVRVFNRDFVHESVFPSHGDVAPIFVIGKQNVEKQKQIEKLKTLRVAKQAKMESERQRKYHANKALDDFCIEQAKSIKNTLRTSGSASFSNYNKSDFLGRAREMVGAGDRKSCLLEDSTREALLSQYRAVPKEKLNPLTYLMPQMKSFVDSTSELLATTVVSAAIESLKKDPGVASWVHQGLGLHQSLSAETCLFCEQPLPKDRLRDLEAHFNAEYELFLKKLDGMIASLLAEAKAAADLVLPSTAELYENLHQEFRLTRSALEEELKRFRIELSLLTDALSSKRGHAFEAVKLSVHIAPPNTEVVANLNMIIERHNRASDDFQAHVDAAGNRLEGDLVSNVLEWYLKLVGEEEECEAAFKAVVAEVDRLKTEIAQLEREIVLHRQPAEELNEELRNYLGHGDLRLEIKETGYVIMRHDGPAESLSEGEMTAIALLYFLKSLQDHRFDLRNGVVVLDDPVSSLDHNAMYAAFGFIRARTENAAQLFIFAHNFTFFRLVRDWFRHLRKKDSRTWRIYMLDCKSQENGRCASLCAIDPLLMYYESEYHYLFSRLKQLAGDPPGMGMEKYYSAPSIARRVLETFLAFKVPQETGENRLWSQMRSVPFDEAKLSRLYRFIQMHSHRNVVGDGDEDMTLLGESRAVLTDLLAFIQKADPEHYSRMTDVVTKLSVGAGES